MGRTTGMNKLITTQKTPTGTQVTLHAPWYLTIPLICVMSVVVLAVSVAIVGYAVCIGVGYLVLNAFSALARKR